MNDRSNMKPTDGTAGFKKYLLPLYRYARPRLKSDREVESVMTTLVETVIKAPQDMDNFSSENKDLNWLLEILRNQIQCHYQDKYRSEESRKEAKGECRNILSIEFVPRFDLANIHAGLLDQFDQATFWDAARECLSLLNPLQADIYVLRELEDVSIDEIGRIIGLSRNDILELVFRARMLFVECLLQRLPEDRSMA